jgi:hypothetical protein
LSNNWLSIDNKNDLSQLNQVLGGIDGSETVEFYGCQKNEPYFPDDVARGFGGVNVHLLIALLERETEGDPHFVECVLIDCDRLDLSFLRQPLFTGRIDSLKRVYIESDRHDEVRCARLIYRPIYQLLQLHEVAYFRSSDSIDET